MATEQRGLCVGLYNASADLSAKQYRYAKISGSKTLTVCAASTDKAVGVIQNKPASGQPVDLMVTGVTKLVAGGTITAGQDLMPDANGAAIAAATAANKSYGVAMEDAVAGQIFEALIPGVTRLL